MMDMMKMKKDMESMMKDMNKMMGKMESMMSDMGEGEMKNDEKMGVEDEYGAAFNESSHKAEMAMPKPMPGKAMPMKKKKMGGM
jgi:hypothetical protein